MNHPDRIHWQADDISLEEENEPLLRLVREHAVTPSPSFTLDRQIRQLARQSNGTGLEEHWLLGQGPRLILVTLIMFAIAMLVLLAF